MSDIFARFLRAWPAAVMAILAGCVVVEGPPPPLPGPAFCTREYAPVCGRLGRDRVTFPNACEADRAGYFILHAGRCRRVRYDGPPPPDRPRFCTSQYDPVCARRGRDRRTFGNECEAERAGYRVVREGACRRDRDDKAEPRPRRDEPRPSRPRPFDDTPRSSRPEQPRTDESRPSPPEQSRSDRRRAEQPDRPAPQAEQPRPPQVAQPRQPPASGGQQACTREYAPVCGQIGSERRTFANACEARNGGARVVSQGAC